MSRPNSHTTKSTMQANRWTWLGALFLAFLLSLNIHGSDGPSWMFGLLVITAVGVGLLQQTLP